MVSPECRAVTEAEWIAFFRRPEIPALNPKMLEHPDADLPRLVFADWVEENCPHTPFVMALRRSIANPDIPEWVPNFSMVVKGHELRLWRGRLEVGIDMSDPEYDMWFDPCVRAAAESGWVGRFKCRGIGERTTGSSAAFSQLQRDKLEWIDLFNANIDTYRLRTLLWRPDATELASLTTLDLRLNTFDDYGAQVIAEAALGGLKTLRLTDSALTDTGRQRLANSKTLPEHIRARFRRPA